MQADLAQCRRGAPFADGRGNEVENLALAIREDAARVVANQRQRAHDLPPPGCTEQTYGTEQMCRVNYLVRGTSLARARLGPPRPRSLRAGKAADLVRGTSLARARLGPPRPRALRAGKATLRSLISFAGHRSLALAWSLAAGSFGRAQPRCFRGCRTRPLEAAVIYPSRGRATSR